MSNPNILLITIDALRADRLGCYGGKRPTSPKLDALAADSVLFTHAISQGPGTPTAFAALLSGRYVSSGSDRGRCGADRVLWSQMLQRHGCQCACIQTSRFLSTEFGYNKGYDFFDQSFLPLLVNTRPDRKGWRAWPNRIPKPVSWPVRQGLKALNKVLYRQAALPASVVTRKIVAWMRSHRDAERPFFLFAHYEDVHEPYAPPAKYVGMFAPHRPDARKLMSKGRYRPGHLSWDEVEDLKRVYDAGIRWVDGWLGILFDYLRQDGLYDDTLIIITADHGEAFNEHGFVSHQPLLYNELLRVPLLMKLPGNRHAGARVGDPVRHIDVVPTVLQTVGVETPRSLDGLSLLPVLEGSGPGPRFCVSEAYRQQKALRYVAVQDCSWKLIRREIDTPEPFHELFHLEADPGERHNLYAARPAPLAALEEALKAHLASRYGGELEAAPSTSEIQRDRLRALGYVE